MASELAPPPCCCSCTHDSGARGHTSRSGQALASPRRPLAAQASLPNTSSDRTPPARHTRSPQRDTPAAPHTTPGAKGPTLIRPAILLSAPRTLAVFMASAALSRVARPVGLGPARSLTAVRKAAAVRHHSRWPGQQNGWVPGGQADRCSLKQNVERNSPGMCRIVEGRASPGPSRGAHTIGAAPRSPLFTLNCWMAVSTIPSLMRSRKAAGRQAGAAGRAAGQPVGTASGWRMGHSGQARQHSAHTHTTHTYTRPGDYTLLFASRPASAAHLR